MFAPAFSLRRRLHLSAVARGGLIAAALLAGLASHAADANLAARPLAPRSLATGTTVFTVVPPGQTGLVATNTYADPKMWAERNQEFSLGSIGTGIAAGDFDNDGKTDLFLVDKTGQCRLYRNLGKLKFEDVTERAGLAVNYEPDGWMATLHGWGAQPKPRGAAENWQQGAAFVDVNNDGWLDLYICRYRAPNLLYINQHDGTFKEEAAARGLAVVDSSGMGSFCDYDRDGWLDVYVHTTMGDAAKHPEGEHDYLFHNNGDGTFTDVTTRAGIAGATLAHSSTWWDYDGDGWPDLYVSNDFAGIDRLYRNNRDGTFTNVVDRVVPHVPYSTMGADTGDLDNDGRIDLIAADMAATTHEKDQRGMATARELYADDSATAIAQYPRNAVYRNTGTARMQEVAWLAGLAATDWTWSVQLADFDNDGRLDVFVTNGMVREYQNADLRQRIILAEDMDDRLRIMRANPTMPEKHLAYRNLGDWRFEEVGASWGMNQTGISFGAVTADLDDDGDLDVVYANYEQPPTLLRNDSATGHRIIVELRGTKSNRFGIGATVRIETAAGVQVRALMPTRGYLSTSEPLVHFGLGADTQIKRLTIDWPSGIVQTFVDLPVDQRFTVTEPKDAKPAVPAATPPTQFIDASEASQFALATRETNNAQSNLQHLIPTRFNHRGPALAAGDLNGDGLTDLVLGGTTGDPSRMLLRQTDGTFKRANVGLDTGTALPDGPILVFDANGDGNEDVLITKAGTALPANSAEYQPRLFLNDGAGGLHPAPASTLPPLPISAGAVAAADYNHDGFLDFVIGGRVLPGKYPCAPRSALIANHGGKFEDVTDAVAPGLSAVGMVSSAIWSDVDGDGWSDLILALEWGQVKYFHNDAGKTLTDWTDRAGFSTAGVGWWTSLATADFNGDGRPDFVVGNVGLNTMYTASAEHPALIYYGDFAKTGTPLLLEAYYEGDRLFPRRGRNELARYIPSVGQRFRRNDLYARATLPEIVGATALQTAQKFAAAQLESGVLLSQADGTYRFEPLPRVAQIAPFDGIAAGDFDGDGHADIYALQNSYAPIPPVGHFDGGLSQMLIGNGHGQFVAAEPATTGLIVPGDAKALVVTDLNADGAPDFVLTTNNARTMAFRNRLPPHRHSLRVTVRGAAPNAESIGARVQLHLRDGSVQTAEIWSGSSYYSQSEPACYFGWTDGNPPVKVVARLPGGQGLEQTVTADRTTVVMQLQ